MPGSSKTDTIAFVSASIWVRQPKVARVACDVEHNKKENPTKRGEDTVFFISDICSPG